MRLPNAFGTPPLGRLRDASRDNNLDALRLIGALMVILGHAYPLSGNSTPIPAIFGVPVHTLGVFIFFVISGYLITKSWARRPRLGSYLAARALRIFPALIVVTVLTIAVLGPIFTSLGLRDYVGNRSTWTYLENIALVPVPSLPGVFEHLPWQNTINGSLWTLPVEFACYLIVPFIMVLPGRAKVVGAIVFGVASAVVLLDAASQAQQMQLNWFVLYNALEPWIFFAAGMLCALLTRPAFFRLDVSLFLALAATVLYAAHPSFSHLPLWGVVPYIVLSAGLASTPVFSRSSRFGDFSYGMYIYAYPVQQIVVSIFGWRSIALNVVVVVALTLLLAYASWHLVESPALRWKARLRRPRAPVVASAPLAPTV
ncbi:acyltransferase [soil metagenome]